LSKAVGKVDATSTIEQIS